MQDSVDGDPCKFVLWSRGSAERFTLQASSACIKMTWVETIAALLDAQNNFLSGEYILKLHEEIRRPSSCVPVRGGVLWRKHW